jgi:hypothetical protein
VTKHHLVIVDWEDSTSMAYWQSIAEHAKEKAAQIQTVGWLIYRDKNRLIVLQSKSDLGRANGSMIIPAGCVRKLRRLK